MSDFVVVLLVFGGSVLVGALLAHMLLDWWEDNNGR